MIIVPRLWVGPTSDVVDCDELDMSHAMAVMEDAGRFGLAALSVRFSQMLEDDDFDFDLVIALAERAGWARTSRDTTSGGTVAISAATPQAAARAMAVTARSFGLLAERIDVEISRIDKGRLAQSHHHVEAHGVRSFMRYARLPEARHVAMRPVPSWTNDAISISEGKKRCAR